MSREVVIAHDAIFGEDPFLMSDHNQVAYREAIVRNLLVYRTRRTTEPFDVDLFNPDEWERFAPPPPAKPSRPPDESALHYHAARAKREAVAEKVHFDNLKDVTIISNGSHTFRRRQKKDGYAPHDVADKDLKAKAKGKGGRFSILDRRLRLAVVGYRVMVSLIPDEAYLDEDLCILKPPIDFTALEELPERDWLTPLGRTRGARATTEWKSALATHIARARERGSHIIMLPEFALPPLGPAEEDDFEKTLKEQAREERVGDHFLLAGTRHEGTTNRALVLAKQGERVSDFWPQYKIASARNMGENVLGPRGTNFPSYTLKFDIPDRGPVTVTVMVAICYDAFDPAIFLKLCHTGARIYNPNGSEHLIVLVPSFNKSEDFVALLRDLSFLTRSLVVYGDALNGNAKLFFCGVALSDLYDERSRLEGKLEKVIDDLVRKYDTYKTTRRNAARRNQLTAEGARTAISRMRHKRDTSQALKRNLDLLRTRGALDHLVTVQPIESPPSTNSRLVDDDLLYYNLDVQLLDVLKKFREDYFLNDDFLPRALQLEELGSLA